MKITNVTQIDDFLAAIDKCKDNVKLTSIYGDSYNLKSLFSRYVAIGALVGEHGDELELFCDSPDDEHYLFEYFDQHPEVFGHEN